MRSAHERAREAGRDAYLEGRALGAVPQGYRPSKSLTAAWERGWRDAARDARDAREGPRITTPEARVETREPRVRTR